MSLIYIGGPMTGRPDFNRPASTGAWTEWTLANQIKMPALLLPCGRVYALEAEKLRRMIGSVSLS